MCTLTWRVTANGYQVLFNRDEQRTRSIAIPPQRFTQDNSTTLMPIDPDGQGSWIACNDSGLSVCLLNYYQGTIPTTANKSRGQLIRQLAYCQSIQQVHSQLEQIEWSQYPPFTLVIFDPQLVKQSTRVASIIWDGVEVKHINQACPLTSSSVHFKAVQTARVEHYRAIRTETPTLNQLVNFHSSHQPQKGAHSVCMHRADAHTVSLTKIDIEADKISMSYLQGSPCQSNTTTKVSIARKIVISTNEK